LVSILADHSDRRPGGAGAVDGIFARILARELSGPPADRVFRAQLRGRVLAAHPVASQGAAGAPGIRTQRLKARRSGVRGPLLGLALVAVLAIALIAGRGVLFPEPLARLGKLPELALEPPSGQGGAAGPGYTFDLTYSLSPQLSAGWPVLPRRAEACRLKPPALSEQHVADLAARLGITAPVVQEGWQDGYLLAADPGDGGPSIRMFPSGYTIYMRPYDYSPVAPSELPSDQKALEIARAWLVSSGFVPEGSLGPGQVDLDPENGMLYVRFKPAAPEPIVSISPFAIVQIGRGETVVMGSATWFLHDASSPYPLRGVAEAWELVENGDGLLEFETREFPGPVGEDNVVRGLATARSVSLGWWLAAPAGEVPYLIPVYVFSGELSVPGGGGTAEYPFQVWAPAVTEAYIQR